MNMDEPDAETQETLKRLIAKAVTAAVDQDTSGAMGALQDISTVGGAVGMYLACCAFSDVGSSLVPVAPANSYWACHLPEDPAKRKAIPATQFLTARLNRDDDMTVAMFEAAVMAGDNGDAVRTLVYGLLGYAANTVTMVHGEPS
jgi:hypothetical protein